MAAEVHAIAAVLDGLRDAAHLRVGLVHQRPQAGAALQLERGGQPGRAGADDDDVVCLRRGQ